MLCKRFTELFYLHFPRISRLGIWGNLLLCFARALEYAIWNYSQNDSVGTASHKRVAQPASNSNCPPVSHEGYATVPDRRNSYLTHYRSEIPTSKPKNSGQGSWVGGRGKCLGMVRPLQLSQEVLGYKNPWNLWVRIFGNLLWPSLLSPESSQFTFCPPLFYTMHNYIYLWHLCS